MQHLAACLRLSTDPSVLAQHTCAFCCYAVKALYSTTAWSSRARRLSRPLRAGTAGHPRIRSFVIYHGPHTEVGGRPALAAMRIEQVNVLRFEDDTLERAGLQSRDKHTMPFLVGPAPRTLNFVRQTLNPTPCPSWWALAPEPWTLSAKP